MEKWTIIEEYLNKLISRLTKLLFSFFKSIIPKKVSEKYTILFNNYKEIIIKIKKVDIGFIKSNVDIIFLKKDEYISGVKNKLKQIESYILKLKDINYKKINFKKILNKFKDRVLNILSWVCLKYKRTDTFLVNGLFILFLIFSISSYLLFLEFEKAKYVYYKMIGHEEIIENNIQKLVRPKYYKQEEKMFIITNIHLQAYHGKDRRKTHKLQLEFSIQATNQYIRNFLSMKQYLIRDTFVSNLAPIAIEFPLTREGKEVVRTKIKSELNKLLRKNNVKGEIENVYIHAIIGG